jgi:hypothetical protein
MRVRITVGLITALMPDDVTPTRLQMQIVTLATLQAAFEGDPNLLSKVLSANSHLVCPECGEATTNEFLNKVCEASSERCDWILLVSLLLLLRFELQPTHHTHSFRMDSERF